MSNQQEVQRIEDAIKITSSLPKVNINQSLRFTEWLATQNAKIAFTSYQVNKLSLANAHDWI